MSDDNLDPVGYAFYASLLTCGFVSTITLGVVWAAIISYIHKFPKDGLSAKAFVAALGIIVTAESIIISIGVFKCFVEHAGDLSYAFSIGLGPLGWIRSLTGSIIVFMTQTFMITKFMKLFRALSYHQRSASRTEVLYWSGSVSLITLAVACFAAGLADPIYLGTMKCRDNFINGTDDSFRVYTIIIETQFTSILIVDEILTVLFSVKLQRSRTGFASSNRVIDVVLLILLRNGFLATALQLTTVVLSRTPDKNMWTMIPGGLISKIYVLTVLAILTKPRDGPNRLSVHSTVTGRPASGPSHQSARALCQSCRSRSRAEPSTRVENETISFGFLEFLQSSGSDILDQLEKKDRYSPSQFEEGQSHGYLDIEVDLGFEHDRGTREIIIEVERQEESFVSPPDHSQQALRHPRQHVLGIKSSDDRNESQDHVEVV